MTPWMRASVVAALVAAAIHAWADTRPTPPDLPPTELARQSIDQAPAVVEARRALAASTHGAAALRAGPNEWTTKLSAQRRRYDTGGTSNEWNAALERTILPGLSEVITADFYKTPVDFQHDYRSEQGAGFSVAPLFRQSAWFRFHNQAEGIKNLYLTGAGTHPGAGLPGVLCSAKVVDRLIPAVS